MGDADHPEAPEGAVFGQDAVDPLSTTKTVVTDVRGPASASDARDACLVVMYGDDLGRRIPLGERTVVIGRSSQADVQLDQESVSRNHCRVYWDGHRHRIEDLQSTNGTYVNDKLLNGPSELRDADQVKVGRAILKFLAGGNIEAQYHEEIYRLTTMDGLTQVHNKRYFDEMLEREASRAERHHKVFSLILFDVDHFKRINDTHGHLAGDAVLRQLGTLVRRRLRRDDVVARIGGEEFALLLPELTDERAATVASDLRELVASTRFLFEGAVIPVTCSFGVAQWSSHHTTVTDLVKAADERLYEAKRSGRNRVCR